MPAAHRKLHLLEFFVESYSSSLADCIDLVVMIALARNSLLKRDWLRPQIEVTSYQISQSNKLRQATF
jgi:hypothetical protein